MFTEQFNNLILGSDIEDVYLSPGTAMCLWLISELFNCPIGGQPLLKYIVDEVLNPLYYDVV